MNQTSSEYDVIVIGGGPAGFMAAIACAETSNSARIAIFERSTGVLEKLARTGGGRCNLTNNLLNERNPSEAYPRGGRELAGPFSRFGVARTMAWFEDHGVALAVEDEGRVFPVSGRAQDVVGCLEKAAGDAGVRVISDTPIRAVTTNEHTSGFSVSTESGCSYCCRALVIAPGGGNEQAYALVRSLGHTLAAPVPSLYGFRVDDGPVCGLAGTSVADAALHLVGIARERGAVLITHEGLSGPAVLRLSSRAARELAQHEFRGALEINWLPQLSDKEIRDAMQELRDTRSKSAVRAYGIREIPSRLWDALGAAADIDSQLTWANLSRTRADGLVGHCRRCNLKICGRSINKGEFVTCGGVQLYEIDMKTMQSRIAPGLFFAGEILDIDGLTGGYNLQAAWTTGRIAGTSAGEILTNAPS